MGHFRQEVIDEIIFRTTHKRNRLMLELMARGGMRIGEVLQLTPGDIDDRKLHIRTPKSRRSGECVFIPQRLSQRLRDYIVAENIRTDDRIFPLTYVGGRRVVMKAGEMAGIHLRPHDLRRFAATYASRAGTPIEVVRKIILRHANLATTQRYLGRIKDVEAIRWIENLYG